jgi:hypothetical protein
MDKIEAGMSGWDVKSAGAEKNLEVDVVVAAAVAD